MTETKAESVALGWASWRWVGGQALLGEERKFQEGGFTQSETVEWMSAGLGKEDAQNRDDWCATAAQMKWMYRLMGGEDTEIATSRKSCDYLADGVPLGLLCHWFWPGCATVKDLEDLIR